MAEKLDSQTRISKLRTLGILDRFPDLVAIADAEKAADAEIAKIETERAAAREAKRLAETPIDVFWGASPGAADDIALICGDKVPDPRRVKSVSVAGRLYLPKKSHLAIGYLPREFQPAFRETSGSGWWFASVRQSVFLLEALDPAQAAIAVARLTSDQKPLLICIYRGVAQSQRPEARSLAALAHAQLSQYAHSLSGEGPRGEQEERKRDKDKAAEIWAMATGDAPAVEEIDRETEQRREAGAQVTRVDDARSARADRDAARAVILEAAEDAKFADAVKAAAGGS